jgi:hypothetical protein
MYFHNKLPRKEISLHLKKDFEFSLILDREKCVLYLVSATVFENTGQDLLEGNRRSGGRAEVAPVARIAEEQQSGVFAERAVSPAASARR